MSLGTSAELKRRLVRRSDGAERRLASVLLELDRVKAERNALLSQSQEFALEQSALQKLESAEELRAQLQETELSRLELADTNTRLAESVAALEAERAELQTKLAVRVEAEENCALQLQESAGVHRRHLRLLASVVVAERVFALARRTKASGWKALRSLLRADERVRRGSAALFFAMRKRVRLTAVRRLRRWREVTTRSHEEVEKATLAQGFHLVLDKQTTLARWRAFCARVAAVRLAAQHQSHVRAFLQRTLVKQQLASRRAVFFAWKAQHFHSKFEALGTQAGALRTQSTQLSQSLHREEAEHRKALMLKAISAMTRQVGAQAKSCIATWKTKIVSFRARKPVLRRILAMWGKLNEVRAFTAWKDAVGRLQLSSAATRTETMAAEIRALREMAAGFERALELENEEKHARRQKRLSRVLRAHCTLSLRTGLRMWTQAALRGTNRLAACRALAALLRKVGLQRTWKAFESNSRRKGAKAARNEKQATLASITEGRRLRVLVSEWFAHFRVCSRARKLLRKRLGRTRLEDLRGGLLAWRERVRALGAQQADALFAQVNREKTEVAEQLTEVELQLAFREAALQSFRTAVQGRSLYKTGKTSLLRLRRRVAESFVRWRTQTLAHRSKQRTATRLGALWSRQLTRRGFRSWTSHTKTAQQLSHAKLLIEQRENTKKQRHSLEAQLADSRKGLAAREEQLMSMGRSLDAKNKLFEDLVFRFGQTKQTRVSRTLYCFEAWKRHIETVRRSSKFLLAFIKKRVLREALRAVRQFGTTQARAEWRQARLSGLVRSLATRGLRTTLVVWHSQVSCAREEELRKEVALGLQQLQVGRQTRHLVTEQLSRRLILAFDSQSAARSFQAWKVVAAQLRKIRKCEESFYRASSTRSLTRALGTLRTHAQLQRQQFRKCMRLLAYSAENIKAEVFAAWSRRRYRLRRGSDSLAVLRRAVSAKFARLAFERVLRQAAVAKQSRGWSARRRSELTARCCFALGKLNVRAGFLCWRTAARRSTRVRNALSRLLASHTQSAQRTAWTHWSGFLRSQREAALESSSETLCILREKLRLLLLLMQREGVDVAQSFLLERESKASALLSLQTNSCLPRCFLLWKWWTAKKRRILRVAFRLRAYRRSPTLLWGFHAWKRVLPQCVLRGLSKRSLTAAIGTLQRDFGRSQSELQVFRHELGSLGEYCRLLESLVRRGRHQAVRVLGLLVRRHLMSALHRWIQKSAGLETELLRQDLADVESELRSATASLIELKAERMALLEENEELRQARAEGMALSAALEGTEQENERMRGELRERGEVLQRLLQENQHLAARIRRNQMELSLTSRR